MSKSPQTQARYRGKNFEYRVAKLVHGVVVGRSKAVKVGGGNNDIFIEVNPQRPPDVITRWLSVECKHTEIPATMLKAMQQSKDNAPSGLIPVVFWGDREKHNLVIMSEKDFLEMHI